MFGKLKKWQQKYCYSNETYNILNLWTLDINDAEIRREYETYRISRVNNMFWPLVCFAILTNIFGWLNYFLLSGELAGALKPLHNFVTVFVLLVPRLCCNRCSPQSVILAQTVTLWYVNLAFRGYLPGHDTPQEKI